MAFPASFIDELIARNPIEDVVGQYVELKRSGSNLFGLCPFHGEKTASFSVAPDKQIYYCFGCHKGGGALNFIMEIESLSYPDAVRHLARKSGMDVPEDESYRSQYKQQERLWALSKDAARYFRQQLTGPAGRQALEYIVSRGLSRQTVTQFGLGFAPDGWSGLLDAMLAKGYRREELLDAGLAIRSEQKGSVYDRFRNRLMFPIIDIRGNVIGFGGRVMDDSKPKYLNSPETLIFNKRKNLFAMNIAKKSKLECIILTEGYMDAIALHQYGFDCAVASLGTALTPEHANLLSKYTKQVVLIYDADEAGQNATRRAVPILEKAGLQVKILRLQGAKDPDEFLKKFGADRFKLLLERSENHAEYRLQNLTRKYDLTLDEQRVEFLKEAAQMISTLPNAIEREIYGARAAKAAGTTPEALKIEVDKAYRRRVSRENRAKERIALSPAVREQPAVRSIHYNNLRSAMAEEGLLRMLLREPTLFDKVSPLTAEQFSAPLLGKAFSLLQSRHFDGLQVSLAGLGEEFSPEELGHLTQVAQKRDELISDEAFADYRRIILNEAAKARLQSGEDLLALRDRLKQQKGYGG
ncbi:MAG: DNA primase [Ruminococcaceae bacterium]|nr:DNA primase [Oscillospiraceae bacterium]